MRSLSARTIVGGIALSAVFLAGCKTEPTYEVLGAPIPITAGKTTPSEDVSRAIIRAGTRMGWLMQSETPGRLSARYQDRGGHSAIVEILYDAKTYSIKYRDSTGLRADGGQIHRAYNAWVMDLDRAIRNELTALGQ